jgi:hypothetical protein
VEKALEILDGVPVWSVHVRPVNEVEKREQEVAVKVESFPFAFMGGVEEAGGNEWEWHLRKEKRH